MVLRGPRGRRRDRRVRSHAPATGLRLQPGGAGRRAPRPPDRSPVEVSPTDPPRWRFWPVLLVALLSFLLANAAVVAAAIAFRIPVGHLDQLSPQQIAILTTAQDGTLAAALFLLLWAWPKVGPADLGLRAPAALGVGVGTGVVLWLASILVANLQAAAVGVHPQALVVAAASHRSPEALALDLVFAAGLVAVVEELFFRAVLFALLRQRLRFAYAATLSSMLFAGAHEIIAWIPVFVLGIGLCWLYEKRHSLWTNALAHGTVNAVSFIVLFLLPNAGS